MPASVIRTLDLCVYEARVLAAHTRYFSIVLRYTLSNINRLCVSAFHVNNSILLEFDVEYLSTLIYEFWNVVDNSIIMSNQYTINLFL